MDEDTIAFLRALCAEAKEVAELCEAYLQRQLKKETLPVSTKEAPPVLTRMLPISKWNKYYDWPTQGTFRNLLLNRHKNGSDYFIRKTGRRFAICEKSFFEWLKMTKEQRINASPEASYFREQSKLK